MTIPINPFDAADLQDLVEARHVVRWYEQLSETMRQRCIETIIDDTAMLAFLRHASTHAQHNPRDFNADVIIDITRRMLEKLRR